VNIDSYASLLHVRRLGYRFERVAGRGKILVRNEPIATFVQEAFEGIAAGRFKSIAQVADHLEQYPTFSSRYVRAG